MDVIKRGAIAVIFTSLRNAADAQGYAAASAAMDAEAARQPGYIGMDAVRDASGEGITISYWQDEAAALAWRAHAEHSAIRDRGRAEWYDRYRVIVTEVSRSYRWERPAFSDVGSQTAKDSMMGDPTTDHSTGKTMLETVPPTPDDDAIVPAGQDSDEALIGSTSVQGVSGDERD